MKKGIVYFVSDGLGSIKIGVTENIKERMRTLQNANANKLEIIYTVRTKTKKEAFKLEAALHRELKDYRVKNEWFEERAVMKLLNRRTVQVEGFKFRGIGNGLKRRKIYTAASAFVLAFILTRLVVIVL